MTLARLTRMGIVEIATRGRQQATTWLERAGLAGRAAWEPALEPARRAFTAAVRARGMGRFFEGAVSERTPLLLAERMPYSREKTLVEADALCRGRFDLLGYCGLSFGDPIDWHLDPFTGRRAPRVHWSRLDPLDPMAGGDCKLIWELNRHQWFVRLGQAYRLTGDERYARAFAAHLDDWMRANPPGVGINWMSSLEVGLRLISWCWALFLFSGSATLDAGLVARILGGISAHAAHVERHLSHYFSPNTHLTGEALSLFYAGVLFPALRPARRWRALGARILEEQSVRQILPDGVYFEHSTCYQRYTIEIYLHFIILAERNAHSVPAELRERVERMLDFMLAVRCPDGTTPQIGDADGGRLLPIAAGAPDDCQDLFSTSAALLRRPEWAWAAGSPSAETLWLLGPGGMAAFEALDAAPPCGSASRLFPSGGYAIMAGGQGPEAHHLILDAGPLGCPVSAGHGHADLLSVQCSVFGKPYMVDPGTCCYTAAPRWRDHFRGTAAHNTVTIDGEGQAIPAGPFSWNQRPEARLTRWLSTERFDLADARHDAYLRLPDPVAHRRRVLFVKPRYWVIVDDLQGSAEHLVELCFQFAPGHIVKLENPSWAVALGPAQRGLLVLALSTVPLEPRILEGKLQPIQGWVSPDYGRRLPSPLLLYSVRARLPLRLATLLLPLEDAASRPPSVAPLMGPGPSLTGIALDGGREFIVIGDEDLSLERG